MPVFTPSIGSQTTGISGGIRKYPNISQLFQGAVIGDDFDRETLSPSGAYPLYTTSTVGSGTFTIGSIRNYVSTTTTSINDANCCRSSGQSFTRVAFSQIDPRTVIDLYIIFWPTVSTNTQGFVGFLNSVSGLTAIPTTTQHIGVYWDTSASNNFILSYSDGITQTTLDTGEALTSHTNAGTSVILHVNWNGNTSCTLSLLNASNVTYKTLTNSSSNINGTYELYFFNKTLTTAASNLTISEWWALAT